MFETIRTMMMQYIEVEENDIKPESKLIEDLGFNSYDFMSILGEIEETFDITIDEAVVMDIHTVQDVIDHIEKLKG